jgi:uncharacterized membrane protein
MEIRKIIILVVSVFVTLAPLFVDFCYNLAKYDTTSDTMAGTFKMYMPVFPLLVAVLFILARDYRRIGKLNKSSQHL